MLKVWFLFLNKIRRRGLFARLERVPMRKDADGFLRPRDIGATIRDEKSLNARNCLINEHGSIYLGFLRSGRFVCCPHVAIDWNWHRGAL